MLLAHGQTADKLWKQLITTTQESESFRQWCVRIATKLVQFIQLTNEKNSSEDYELSYTKKAKSLDSLVDTLLKFLIFEGCSKEQKPYFLERKFVQLSFDEFQELGVAFQQAHCYRHTGKDRIPKAESIDFDDDNQSMQTWKISVQDTVAVLKKKPLKERFDYVREKHLCLNCLMPHHIKIDCVSKARCLKCKKKHHYWLHSNSYGESQKQRTNEGHKQTKQDTKVKMVSCLNDTRPKFGSWQQ